MDRNTGICTRNVEILSQYAACTRLRTGKSARNSGTYLFQERKCQPDRFSQTELCAGSGILLQRRRRHKRYYRNRCGPMGSRPFLRCQGFRSRSRRLSGKDQLRTEALPPQHYADFRCTSHSFSVYVYPCG